MIRSILPCDALDIVVCLLGVGILHPVLDRVGSRQHPAVFRDEQKKKPAACPAR